MVLKRLCISNTWEGSAVHIHCSDLGETELQAFTPGDRALSQYDSLSGKMVLKWPCGSDTGEVCSLVQVS